MNEAKRQDVLLSNTYYSDIPFLVYQKTLHLIPAASFNPV